MGGEGAFGRVGFIVTNRTDPVKGIVHFYNGRGTCEQWIKEGKYALDWMRLSCHKFKDNAVRLALFVLAYNLRNFLRRFALPKEINLESDKYEGESDKGWRKVGDACSEACVSDGGSAPD